MINFLFELFNFLSLGGIILIPLFILSQIAWFLCFKQWLFLKQSQFSTEKILNLNPISHLDLEQTLKQHSWNGILKQIIPFFIHEKTNPNLEHFFEKKIHKIRPNLTQSLTTISVITRSLPLLGLLGTVQGIKITFDLMQEFGNGNPAILSSGISTALLTTQTSLILAIPLVLFHNYLCNQAHRIEQKYIQSGNQLLTLNNQFKS